VNQKAGKEDLLIRDKGSEIRDQGSGIRNQKSGKMEELTQRYTEKHRDTEKKSEECEI
jgi:hypothetical protein